MPNVTGNYAPYAAPKNVMEFIRRKRERGMPDIITAKVLEQIGIPQGNVPRTLRAVRFLGLIGEDGRRSELLERIGAAAVDEYPRALAEMVRAAYQPVFAVVDPSLDATGTVVDAFRGYQPASQRSRMAALFFALCREAGLAGNRARRSAGPAGKRPNVGHRSDAASVTAWRSTAPSSDSPGSASPALDAPALDYGLVSALVQKLPASARWSKRKRQKWLQAIASAVDLMVEVVDE